MGVDRRFSLFGNSIDQAHDKRADRWRQMFVEKFGYDPDEEYVLTSVPNRYLDNGWGLRDVVRSDEGEPISADGGILVGTVRMGFGHYRIAMAGASAAAAMGLTPYWLDLLSLPGITSDVINWWNTNYSKFSRLSQRSPWFNKHVWESITTGERTLPGLDYLLNRYPAGWPWRFVKANARDYRMSELFGDLHRALPSDMPLLASHMWNAMGAVAGGMTGVVNMMFDNWPMAFQLIEGAQHGVQSPSGYYGFRVMRGFDEGNRMLEPTPEVALHYVGHHLDHELVENIEVDSQARLDRMDAKEPRRLMLTMGGAGAQRELFAAVIEHCMPLVEAGVVTLYINLGDHAGNWDWLQQRIGPVAVTTHFDWQDTLGYVDAVREESTSGVHVFLHDNIFHGVYATNYLMRVSDVMITKPSELAFYPVPKIFNERVGGHEAWGAIRSAELGDGTVETRTIPETLQAIDMLTRHDDLFVMYCESIVRNKSIGIYDGAYKCVELATGRRWVRDAEGRGSLQIAPA
ncbi:MAG: hypothetical protein WED83_01530 [Acidimicrobiia bacterium]